MLDAKLLKPLPCMQTTTALRVRYLSGPRAPHLIIVKTSGYVGVLATKTTATKG